MTNITMRVKPNPLNGLIETQLSADVRHQLAIAKATHGGSALRNTALEQGPHLPDESPLDLVAHAVVDGAIESVARHGQADLKGLERRWSLAFLGRHGDAGRLVDLDGSNDATKVAAASFGCRGVNLAESLGEAVRTACECFGLKGGTERVIRGYTRHLPTFDDSVDVERCAANEDREPLSSQNVFDGV